MTSGQLNPPYFNTRFTPAENAFLAELPMFANASEETKSFVFSRLKKRTYRKGEVIYHQDDVPSHLYIILNGQVAFKSKTEDGREYILSFFSAPGDIFGLRTILSRHRQNLEAVAARASELFLMDASDFRDYYASNQEVSEYVLDVYSARLDQQITKLRDLIFLDGKGRLARELLNHCPDEGDSPELVPALAQTDLAALTGSTPESINRWLKFFERQGVVSLSSGTIQIINRTALEGYVST